MRSVSRSLDRQGECGCVGKVCPIVGCGLGGGSCALNSSHSGGRESGWHRSGFVGGSGRLLIVRRFVLRML